MADHVLLDYLAPFLSGAFGVGVMWGYVRHKIPDLTRRLTIVETKLENQVGDPRCTRMRTECRQDIVVGMQRIEKQILDNRDYVTDRFVEIARFMGQHNGH